MSAVHWLILLWILGILAIAWRFRQELAAAWREPVLKRPIVIVESDDWGPGPASDADALRALVDVLAEFRDRSGRHPVATLGLLLAVPDRAAIRAEGCAEYRRLTLDSPDFAAIRDAIAAGVERGVFSLQLHGLEHFWPPALLRAASADPGVRTWLEQGAGHEALPAHLQSRWVDAATLPSQPLDAGEIEAAASEEVRAFARAFGRRPKVAVPPTFVWTDDVERGWAAEGIEVVVTPGRRYTARDAAGRPAAISASVTNGARSAAGACYVVRDVYFEPALGHRAARALEAVRTRARLRRPALMESHRTNFVGQGAARSLDELRRLLAAICDEIPEVAFASTEELAQWLRTEDPGWIDPRPLSRLHAALLRLYETAMLRKLAWLTGLVFPGWLIARATGGR